MDVGVKSQSKQKKSKIQGFMDKIEMLGNKLPHPVLMFIYISIFVYTKRHNAQIPTHIIPASAKNI